ncbi:MAG: DUF3048 domain-containing protein [Lachnospiraceae bacterium]|nr:DUF3048 domain-containing protein [Lachnospiraceae bacterium]
MKKTWRKIGTGLMAAAMLAGSIFGSAATASAEEGSNGMVRSFLTGKLVPESIGREKAISVMFNNIQAALPQSGIANAEVVYEAPVEGGITRLMGILEDYQDVERIGSVRSCRDYFIYFAREFNTYYLHFGQAVYALDLLNYPSTLNLSGLEEAGAGEGEIVYYRSDDFPAPHNVFTNYNMIHDGIRFREYPTEYSDEYLGTNGHYKFASDDAPVTLDQGVDAAVVVPGYEYNHAYFVYDSSTGKYTRYQYGGTQIDYLTGNPLTYDNIIFQYCPWQNYDENGYLNIDVLAGGSGKYITKGKAIDITWSKDSIDREDKFANENFGLTHYYDANGEEITLNQGKTWVCIVLDTSSDNVAVYPDADSFANSGY